MIVFRAWPSWEVSRLHFFTRQSRNVKANCFRSGTEAEADRELSGSCVCSSCGRSCVRARREASNRSRHGLEAAGLQAFCWPWQHCFVPLNVCSPVAVSGVVFPQRGAPSPLLLVSACFLSECGPCCSRDTLAARHAAYCVFGSLDGSVCRVATHWGNDLELAFWGPFHLCPN